MKQENKLRLRRLTPAMMDRILKKTIKNMKRREEDKRKRSSLLMQHRCRCPNCLIIGGVSHG